MFSVLGSLSCYKNLDRGFYFAADSQITRINKAQLYNESLDADFYFAADSRITRINFKLRTKN